MPVEALHPSTPDLVAGWHFFVFSSQLFTKGKSMTPESCESCGSQFIYAESINSVQPISAT
jgi:hypothetical protein